MQKIVVAMIACAALALLTTAIQADSGKGKGGNNQPAQSKVEGRIVAVGESSVTITTARGQSLTVLVTAQTKVERNDRRVPLASLRVGDRGQALFTAATMVASKVEGVGPR
jgi:hypothetical protein